MSTKNILIKKRHKLLAKQCDENDPNRKLNEKFIEKCYFYNLPVDWTEEYTYLNIDENRKGKLNNIYKVLKGIEINKTTRALDLIREVGPGGEFLTRQHTFNHMRQMSSSSLFDRRNREKWMQTTGGKDLTSRAYEETLRILKTHKAFELPNGADEAMKDIIKEYEAAIL